MLNNIISINAKLITELLSEKDMQTIDELKLSTGYREQHVYLVLGWLSREGKMSYLDKDDVLYIRLGNSNL